MEKFKAMADLDNRRIRDVQRIADRKWDMELKRFYPIGVRKRLRQGAGVGARRPGVAQFADAILKNHLLTKVNITFHSTGIRYRVALDDCLIGQKDNFRSICRHGRTLVEWPTGFHVLLTLPEPCNNFQNKGGPPSQGGGGA